MQHNFLSKIPCYHRPTNFILKNESPTHRKLNCCVCLYCSRALCQTSGIRPSSSSLSAATGWFPLIFAEVMIFSKELYYVNCIAQSCTSGWVSCATKSGPNQSGWWVACWEINWNNSQVCSKYIETYLHYKLYLCNTQSTPQTDSKVIRSQPHYFYNTHSLNPC